MTGLKKNEYGFTLYPKGHFGRSINIVKAIHELGEDATVKNISKYTEQSVTAVINLIKKLNSDYLTNIELLKISHTSF